MAEIKITLKPIDLNARGSQRKRNAFKKMLAHVAASDNPDGFEDQVRFILDNADVKAPEGVDVFEELMDYPANELDAMVKAIMGGDGVPPTNGA